MRGRTKIIGENTVKLGIFLVLTMAGLAGIISLGASPVSAECCYGTNFCIDPTLQGIGREECEGLGAIFEPTLECAQITSCTEQGCCCGVGYSEYSRMFECSAEFIPTTNTNCAAVCIGQSFSIVSGTVSYNDGVNAPATIYLLYYPAAGQEESFGPVVATQGQYSAEVYSDEAYKVTASIPNRPECNYVFDSIQVAQTPVTHNIVLPCESTVQTQCVSVWTWDWLDPDNACGYRENITDINNCNPPTSPPPANYVPCISDPSFSCNPDGVIQQGEVCDPVGPVFQQGLTLCSDLIAGSSGNLGCSPVCRLTTEQCDVCPVTVTGCTELSMCANCQNICLGASICLGGCSETDIPELEVSTVFEEKAIQLDWTFDDCFSDLVGYELGRCKADSTGTACIGYGPGAYNIIANLPKESQAYYDGNLPPDAQGAYCYNLTALLFNQQTGTYQRTSGLTCGFIVEDECLGEEPNIDFCSSISTIGTCDEDGQYSVEDDCGSGQCIGPMSDGTVLCQDVSVCELCNGPFAQYGLMFPPLDAWHIDDFVDCRDTLDGSLSGVNICYVDEYSITHSSIGQYKACSEVRTCYDYKTQNSCEDDPCGEGYLDCSWNPIGVQQNGDDLGLGVCVPVEVSDQECSRCETDSILGSCPEELCMLYGDAGKCYYNAVAKDATPVGREFETDKNNCMNIEDVSCETYETVAQCIGLNPSQAFSVDITYNQANPEIMYGTNNINAESNDTLGLGRCFWSTQKNECFKDSDNSRTIQSEAHYSDCENDDMRCLTDMEYPTTEILYDENGYYSVPEMILLQINKTDNKYNDAELTTYFDIFDFEAMPVNYQRPQTLFEDLDFERPAGPYALVYFSKDPAQNYEPVNQFIFNLISDLSGVRVVISNTSFYDEGADVFLTNLSVSVSHSLPLTCSTKLFWEDESYIVFDGDETKHGSALSFNYNGLFDGSYQLNVSCWDEHLQEFFKSIRFSLEADTTIRDVFPRGKTYNRGTVKLEMNTTEEGECYYLLNPIGYEPPIPPTGNFPESPEWKRFDETGGEAHSVDIPSQDTGLYFAFTGCMFEDYFFYGNYGDLAYWATDAEDPIVIVNDVATGGEYNSSVPTESVTLEFECIDYLDALFYNGNSWAFGCDDLSLCSYRGSGSCTPEKQTGSGPWQKTFTLQPGSGATYVVINMNDTGGNMMEDEMFLNLRNLTFLPPNVTICDPEKGIPCG